MTEEDLKKINNDAWTVALGLTVAVITLVFVLVRLT